RDRQSAQQHVGVELGQEVRFQRVEQRAAGDQDQQQARPFGLEQGQPAAPVVFGNGDGAHWAVPGAAGSAGVGGTAPARPRATATPRARSSSTASSSTSPTNNWIQNEGTFSNCSPTDTLSTSV